MSIVRSADFSGLAQFISAYDAFHATALAVPENVFLCVPAEASAPDVICVEYTYGEALRRVEALREVFIKSCVGYGSRIAVLFGNTAEYHFCFLALNALGAWTIPINPDSTEDEILYLITHSHADIALTTPARLEHLLKIGEKRSPSLRVGTLQDVPEVARSPEAPAARLPSKDSVASVLYTSGTTGKPKGCLISNEYYLTAGQWYLARGGLAAVNFGSDRIFNPFPAHHMNAGVVSFMAMVLSGGCLIHWDRFHPRTWWRDLAATKATIFHYMGIVPGVLVKQPATDEERNHCVRFGWGAGVDPAIHVAFEERFGFPLIEIWGMTETGRTIVNATEPRRITTRAFGKADDGLEAIIADENDRSVPEGADGQLLVRFSGANPRKGFFSGYLNDDAATEGAWRGGWFHTGDVCRMDEAGVIHFVDRKKNIIRRSGENISAAEVEESLIGHPHVFAAAVVPVFDEIRDEEVLACIVVGPGVEPSRELALSILAHCSARLSYFKIPSWIIFRDELPTTQTGKIQKEKILSGKAPPPVGALCYDFRSEKRHGARVAG